MYLLILIYLIQQFVYLFIYSYIYIHTGVGKSRFTVVRTEKRHAGYDYYNTFINNNNNNKNKKTNSTKK
jgi:hypothetical protein